MRADWVRTRAGQLQEQDIDVPEWQANQVITFEVTDLDLCGSELTDQNLEERFPGVKL